MTVCIILSVKSQEISRIQLKDIVAQEKSTHNFSSVQDNENNTTDSRSSLLINSSSTFSTSNETNAQQPGRIHIPHPQVGRPISGAENFSRYQNDTYKMTIFYPNSWQKVQSANNISSFFREGDNDSYQERIVIDIFPSGNIP